MQPTTPLPISMDLREAYFSTHFKVFEPVQFILKIDTPSKELDGLYQDYGVSTAAFLTAWNPHSKPTALHDNERAQRHLRRKIEEVSVAIFSGVGEDPTGQWPGEPSFLALGVSREESIRLGNEFRQNALVWIGVNAVPELVYLG